MPPEDARAVFVGSLAEAWLRVAGRCIHGKDQDEVPERAKIRGQWDEPLGAAPRGDVHFRLEGSAFAGFKVTIPALVRSLEHETLSQPEQLGTYSLSVEQTRSVSEVEIRRRDEFELGEGAEAQNFIAARRDFFAQVAAYHVEESAPSEERSARFGLLETVDLVAMAPAIERYAQAWVTLATGAAANAESRQAVATVQGLAHLDLVELRWRESAGDPGRALLMAPTHPLRVLWHLRHAQACDAAVRAGMDKTKALEAALSQEALPPRASAGSAASEHAHGCVRQAWTRLR